MSQFCAAATCVPMLLHEDIEVRPRLGARRRSLRAVNRFMLAPLLLPRVVRIRRLVAHDCRLGEMTNVVVGGRAPDLRWPSGQVRPMSNVILPDRT
jgi:hypothetical protein